MAHIAARRVCILRNSLGFFRPQVRTMVSEYGSGEGKVCSVNTVQEMPLNVCTEHFFELNLPGDFAFLLAYITL